MLMKLEVVVDVVVGELPSIQTLNSTAKLTSVLYTFQAQDHGSASDIGCMRVTAHALQWTSGWSSAS
jgi:hypothetical protein